MSLMGASNPVPSTSLFVDHFQLSDSTRRLHPGAVFCLTHCHSDHMVGLSPHWKLGDLHTSTSTAPFLQRKFGVGLPLKTHPMDEPFSVWDPKSRMMLTCTFVDAGHCPGSVMLICEGFANGRGPVIHTGDFRYYDELNQNETLRRVANLASAGIADQRCQHLFLDATCAHPSLYKLPVKKHSIGQLLDLLDRFSKDTIFLHSHGLGDEELLSAVGNWLGSGKLKFACKDRYEEVKIWDPSFCQRFCELLPPKTESQSDSDAQLPNVQQVIIVANSRTRHCDVRLQHMVGIEISCSTLWYARRALSAASGTLNCGYKPLTFQAPVTQDHSLWQPLCDQYGVWHIVWSMHSSGEELQRFVDLFKPLQVHAICPTLLSDDRAWPNTARLTIGARPEPAAPEAGNLSMKAKPSSVTARETRMFFNPDVQHSIDDTLIELFNLPDGTPGPSLPMSSHRHPDGVGFRHDPDGVGVRRNLRPAPTVLDSPTPTELESDDASAPLPKRQRVDQIEP